MSIYYNFEDESYYDENGQIAKEDLDTFSPVDLDRIKENSQFDSRANFGAPKQQNASIVDDAKIYSQADYEYALHRLSGSSDEFQNQMISEMGYLDLTWGGMRLQWHQMGGIQKGIGAGLKSIATYNPEIGLNYWASQETLDEIYPVDEAFIPLKSQKQFVGATGIPRGELDLFDPSESRTYASSVYKYPVSALDYNEDGSRPTRIDTLGFQIKPGDPGYRDLIVNELPANIALLGDDRKRRKDAEFYSNKARVNWYRNIYEAWSGWDNGSGYEWNRLGKEGNDSKKMKMYYNAYAPAINYAVQKEMEENPEFVYTTLKEWADNDGTDSGHEKWKRQTLDLLYKHIIQTDERREQALKADYGFNRATFGEGTDDMYENPYYTSRSGFTTFVQSNIYAEGQGKDEAFDPTKHATAPGAEGMYYSPIMYETDKDGRKNYHNVVSPGKRSSGIVLYKQPTQNEMKIKLDQWNKDVEDGYLWKMGDAMYKEAKDYHDAMLQNDATLQALIDWQQKKAYTFDDLADARLVMYEFGKSIPSQATTMGAFAAGAVVGLATKSPRAGQIVSGTLGFLNTFALEGGGAYSEVEDFFNDPANAIHLEKLYGPLYKEQMPIVAAELAFDTGIPNAILEMLPVGHLAYRWGMANNIKKKLIKSAINDSFLKRVATGGRDLLGGVILQSVEESATEVLQTLNELAQMEKVKGEISEEEKNKALRMSAYGGFVGGGGIASLGSTVQGADKFIGVLQRQYKYNKDGEEIYSAEYVERTDDAGNYLFPELYERTINNPSLKKITVQDKNGNMESYYVNQTYDEQSLVRNNLFRNPFTNRNISVAEIEDDVTRTDVKQDDIIEQTEQEDAPMDSEIPNIVLPNIEGERATDADFQGFTAFIYEQARRVLRTGLEASDGTVIQDFMKMFGGTKIGKLVASKKFKTRDILMMAFAEYGAEILNTLDNETKYEFKGQQLTVREFAESVLDGMIRDMPSVQNSSKKAQIVKNKILNGNIDIKYSKSKDSINTGADQTIDINIPITKEDVNQARDAGIVQGTEYEALINEVEREEAKIVADEIEREILEDEINEQDTYDVQAFMDYKIKGAGSTLGNLASLAGKGNQDAQSLRTQIIDLINNKGKRADLVELIKKGNELVQANQKKTPKNRKAKGSKTNNSQANKAATEQMGDEAVDHADEISFFGEEDSLTLEDMGLTEDDVTEVKIDDTGTKVKLVKKDKKKNKKQIKELESKVKVLRKDLGKIIAAYKGDPSEQNEIYFKNAMAMFMEVTNKLAELKGIDKGKTRFKKLKSKRNKDVGNKDENVVVLGDIIKEFVENPDLLPGFAEAMASGQVAEFGAKTKSKSFGEYLKVLLSLAPSLYFLDPSRKKAELLAGGKVDIEAYGLRKGLEMLKAKGKKLKVIILNDEGLERYSNNYDELLEIHKLMYDVLDEGGFVIGMGSNLSMAAGNELNPFQLMSNENRQQEYNLVGLEVLMKIPEQQIEETTPIDNTTDNNTAPDTSPAVDPVTEESIGDIMDEIVSDIIEVGKSYVTPPKTMQELNAMSLEDLQAFAKSIKIEFDNDVPKDELIGMIREAEGDGGNIYSSILPPPLGYKRLAAALDRIWANIKKLGKITLDQFVSMRREEIKKKYSGGAQYEMLVLLNKWWQDTKVAENPNVLDDLGFNTRNKKQEARDFAAKDEKTKAESVTEEDIVSEDIEGLDVFLEDINPTDIDEVNFEKNHAHTMVKRRFLGVMGTIDNKVMEKIVIMARDYNGIATEDIANRNIMVNEGDNLNQERFLTDFVVEYSRDFPKLLDMTENDKNKIRHMWLINQEGNKMPFKIEQQFVVLNGKLQTRPEKLYNVADPSTVVPSFIEADAQHGQYIMDHVAIMRADNVFKQHKGFYFKDNDIKIDRDFLANNHIMLGKMDWAIVGVKAGTMPSIVFAKVTEEDKVRARNWKSYWTKEFDDGKITQEDLDNYLNFPSFIKENKLPPHLMFQEVTSHEMMKKMRWDNYASEGGGVVGLFKRLKLDMSRGIKLVGFRGAQKGEENINVVNFDSKDVIFKKGNNVVPHIGQEGTSVFGKYLHDGLLFTSGRFMNDFSTMFGTKVHEIKPVIRVRDDNGNYVCVKCHSQVPMAGINIYEKNANGSEGRLIASFKETVVNGKPTVEIIDAQGNQIDFIGSQEEFKNKSGKFSRPNIINSISGEDFRVLSLDKTSKTDSAFPKVWLDLLSDPVDKEIRNLLLEHLHKNLKQDFFREGGPASNIFKVFSDPKNEKYIQGLLKQLTRENDTLPNSVAEYIRNLDGGYSHPVFLEELKEVVKNRVFVDYVLKGRIKGGGTMSSFSPNMDGSIKPGEVHMGVTNKWISSIVKREYEKVHGNPPANLDEMNLFLQTFDVSIMGIRQPINGKAGVKMLRVTQLLPEYRGNITALNEEDTFSTFMGDHDGDHIFFLGFDAKLTQKLKDHMSTENWKESAKETTDLDKFEQADTNMKYSSLADRFTAMEGNTGALGSIGTIISTKRVRGQLINKEIKDFKIGNMTVRLVNPSDEVIMDYAPLDKDNISDIPENKIEVINGIPYLKTTSENEIAILANAATDNPDRVLLNKWGYDANWLKTRVFRIVGPQGELSFLNPEVHKKEIQVLSMLLSEYKVLATYEKGRDSNRKSLKLNNLMNISNLVLQQQTDEAKKVMRNINNMIARKFKQSKGFIKLPKISELELDDSQKSVGQLLIGMMAHYENKHIKDNKHIPIGNNGFMSKPENRVQKANIWASRVLEQKRGQYVKQYKITEQDVKDGNKFLRMFLFGKGASFDTKKNKWTHKRDEDGNAIGGGFYTIFEQLEQEHNDAEAAQAKSAIMMSGYTYNQGFDALIEEFFDDFTNLSEGAQASFIYGFFAQAPVSVKMHMGNQIATPAVLAKNIKKFLPQQFATVYRKDGKAMTRDWKITNDWFTTWSIEFDKGSAPSRKALAEKQMFAPINEITKC